MRFKAFVVAFACVSCLATSLIAHHSHGNYDVQTWTTMEGTVKQGIFLKGVKKEDVQVGDTIKVRCHLLRDGGRGCLLGFVTPMHGDKARGHGIEIEWD